MFLFHIGSNRECLFVSVETHKLLESMTTQKQIIVLPIANFLFFFSILVTIDLRSRQFVTKIQTKCNPNQCCSTWATHNYCIETSFARSKLTKQSEDAIIAEWFSFKPCERTDETWNNSSGNKMQTKKDFFIFRFVLFDVLTRSTIDRKKKQLLKRWTHPKREQKQINLKNLFRASSSAHRSVTMISFGVRRHRQFILRDLWGQRPFSVNRRRSLFSRLCCGSIRGIIWSPTQQVLPTRGALLQLHNLYWIGYVSFLSVCVTNLLIVRLSSLQKWRKKKIV